MSQTAIDAPVVENAWDDLEARLSEGRFPPLRILFATDGSASSAEAEALLSKLELPGGSSIRVVTVLDLVAYLPKALLSSEKEWALSVTEGVAGRLSRPGVEVTTMTPAGSPAAGILAAAAEFKPDLLVIGSQGRTGLDRFLVGSVAESVVRHAGCPVLVNRSAASGLGRVVLAVDGSEHSNQAVRLAGHLPLPADAEINIVSVVKPYALVIGPEFIPNLEQMVEEVNDRQIENARMLVVGAADRLNQWGKKTFTTVRSGDPGCEILALAEDLPADLLIIGARGISPFEAMLVGSVADRLLRHAPCSVLIVR